MVRYGLFIPPVIWLFDHGGFTRYLPDAICNAGLNPPSIKLWQRSCIFELWSGFELELECNISPDAQDIRIVSF